MAPNPANSEDARAALYLSLAEGLAEPPDWLAEAGGYWPLFTHARRLAAVSPAAAQAVAALASIEAEPVAQRRQRYAALFAGTGSPRFWLYESMHRSGRLLGQETVAVERLYHAAGLQLGTAELPDNASVELSFLAYLAQQAAGDERHRRQWSLLERRFIREHAGCWLPALGRALAKSGDAVYSPIGQLLAGWLAEAARPAKATAARSKARRPQMVAAEACTLCGFCVQVCRPRALRIEESETVTRLMFSSASCTGCRQCEQVCQSHALAAGDAAPSSEWAVWRDSPRQACPGCGRPTVSRAELEYVRRQIGEAGWFEYCLLCRQ